MEEQIVFGDEMVPITLPDDVQIAPPGLSTTLSAVDDIEATVRQALQEPIGRPLLSETARPNWKGKSPLPLMTRPYRGLRRCGRIPHRSIKR